jgi:hypothetical protein
MSEDITAIATLVCALASFVTAAAGAWIGIASHLNLAKRVQQVHNNTDTMNEDLNQVKSDMFSLTSVLTQSVVPVKKDP